MADTLPALIPTNGVDNYRISSNAATVCGDIVKATAKDIQGRKYVCVEGWQAIAVAHGCAATSCNVERVEGGVRATGQVRRMDSGTVIAEAEGFVGEDEPVWFGGETIDKWGKKKTHTKRADFAIRAMAQTRAISRACRSAFAHVVVLIDRDLGTTPAEEMMGVIDHEPVEAQPHKPGALGAAAAGTHFRPDGPRRMPPKGDFVEEARQDGTLDETRAKGTLPAAKPSPTSPASGQAIKRVEWVKNSIAAFPTIGTSEGMSEWWRANKERIDVIETAMPTEFDNLIAAYDARFDALKALVA